MAMIRRADAGAMGGRRGILLGRQLWLVVWCSSCEKRVALHERRCFVEHCFWSCTNSKVHGNLLLGEGDGRWAIEKVLCSLVCTHAWRASLSFSHALGIIKWEIHHSFTATATLLISNLMLSKEVHMRRNIGAIIFPFQNFENLHFAVVWSLLGEDGWRY